MEIDNTSSSVFTVVTFKGEVLISKLILDLDGYAGEFLSCQAI